MQDSLPQTNHTLLWTPTQQQIQDSNLTAFTRWLEQKGLGTFANYQALWQWSIDDTDRFWNLLSSYSGLGSKQYAESLMSRWNDSAVVLVFGNESGNRQEWTGAQLRQEVQRIQQFLQENGITKGDRVVAYLPNIPEATIAMLATTSLGAIWSSCSPDFGVNGVIDRFAQIEPVVLFAVDGYQYGGKTIDKLADVQAIQSALPTLKHTVLVPYLGIQTDLDAIDWRNAGVVPDTTESSRMHFEKMAATDPLWVLYSSGTTGKPKAIVHSHGGIVQEHFKYLHLHNDVKPGERFFWYTTTGWMMWNFVHGAWLSGGVVVLYDGSPAYPYLNTLWDFAAETGIAHFGTSAPFLAACQKAELSPNTNGQLNHLRSIGSTGSPLAPESFDWVYAHIHRGIWLCSMSGGTDVCTAFVGSCIWEPVYQGEIQCRALGCALYAWSEEGEELIDEVGEMVVTKPMPSMPIYFWGDTNNERYLESYYSFFSGVWRHGDWVSVHATGSIRIMGRSDATLNRQGIRIGTAEIYRVVEQIPGVKDALIIHIENQDGKGEWMPLFVVTEQALSPDLITRIKNELRQACSPRHVPDEVIAIPQVPYTISGKKMETPVKKILQGMPKEQAANAATMRNPESLDFFVLL